MSDHTPQYSPHSRARARSSVSGLTAGRSLNQGQSMLSRHSSRYGGGAASQMSGSTRAGASAQSEQLSGIVARQRQHAAVLKETTAAADAVEIENDHMRDLLSEQHAMVSNAHLAGVINAVFLNEDGTANSSILQRRKPPNLRMVRRAQMLPEQVDDERRAIGTGKPNFAVLQQQQQEQLARREESRPAYDQMIKDFVQGQQSLTERFSGLFGSGIKALPPVPQAKEGMLAQRAPSSVGSLRGATPSTASLRGAPSQHGVGMSRASSVASLRR
jgi:hypothetical protein